MEKEKTNMLITDAAKTIFSYCRVRTNSKEEAEDLSQDIMLQLLRNKGSFCNDKVFYGFMWSVAGNVYKDWCKKRKKSIECELDESISDDSVPLSELFEKESDLMLLYRELSLLTEQYRKVVVLYYFNDCKVSEISKSLHISESMTKFLLFKSRKILRKGMSMERTKGELGFNPRKMSIRTLRATSDYSTAEHSHSIENLVAGNLLAQNILFSCYNDRCTAEGISLQIGVAVPYLEKDLKKLCEKGLLIQKGVRYETDIVIFTKECSEETNNKTLRVHREIADIIDKCLTERLSDIKAVGFHKGVEDDNLLKWHIAHILLNESGMKYANSLNLTFPTKYAGMEAIVYATEHYSSIASMRNMERSNANEDKLIVHDFSINKTRDCLYFDRYPNRVNIILDVARGKTSEFSENDMVEVAEFIERGYISKNGDNFNLNLPVFTKEQYNKVKTFISDVTDSITEKMREAVNIATSILVQHTPVSLKKDVENIGWTQARDCGFSPIKIMMDNSMLNRVSDNAHPTIFILLNRSQKFK